MDYTKKSPIVLSLCPGMLGLERGFERASSRLNWKPHKTAAYVEIESFINWNLVNKMEKGLLDPAPIWSDIKTFPSSIFRNKIDGLFAGYPCQPFSKSGERKGDRDERHLWPHISAIIESIKPLFCFFENVSGHLTLGFDEVYRSLSDMGYRIEAGIFTAEEIGSPHERERLFILACLANPNSTDSGGKFGEISIKTDKVEEETWKQNGQWMRNEFRHSSKKMGYTNGSRQWRKTNNKQPSEQLNETSWPAPQGPDQYEWEAPRVKPRMGFTINGYNFREDLLRMAGNGVVEQSAEIAFLNLFNKFII